MRKSHQRGIEQRQAEIVAAVKEWALANGWDRSGRSASALYRMDGTKRYRLDFGPRYLREQVWEERNYDSQNKGFWKNVFSCPWSLVRIESNQLIREQNACRPPGTKLKERNE